MSSSLFSRSRLRSSRKMYSGEKWSSSTNPGLSRWPCFAFDRVECQLGWFMLISPSPRHSPPSPPPSLSLSSPATPPPPPGPGPINVLSMSESTAPTFSARSEDCARRRKVPPSSPPLPPSLAARVAANRLVRKDLGLDDDDELATERASKAEAPPRPPASTGAKRFSRSSSMFLVS